MNFSLLQPLNEPICQINNFPEEFSSPIQPSSMIFIVVLISTLALLILHFIPDSSEKIERLKPHAHLISNIDPKITGFFHALLASDIINPAEESLTLYGYMEIDLREVEMLRMFANPNDRTALTEPIKAHFKEIAPALVKYFSATALKKKLSVRSYDRLLIGVTLVRYRKLIRGYHQDRRTGQFAQKIADITLAANSCWKKIPKDDAFLVIYQPSSVGTILPTVSVYKKDLAANALPTFIKDLEFTSEEISTECVGMHRDRFAFPVITSDSQALVINNRRAFHATPTINVVKVLYGSDHVNNFFNSDGSLNDPISKSPFLHISAAVYASGSKQDSLSYL